MLDIPKIYEDPIISRKRLGTAIQPFRPIKESMTVNTYYALLTEIPNRYEKVKVTGQGRNFYEIEDGEFLSENTFKVDYTNGHVYFHESLDKKTLHFEYLGEGVFLFPDSRVYFSGEGSFPTVRDKFVDVDRAIKVERNRISEQIISHPQPSEVVDQRIDFNGKIFKVAKDRIDSEQQKIEEAYFDAKGKKHNSLKLRIDSLQLATEEEFDDQNKENVDLWASIDLIPGQIKLETGKLKEHIDGTQTLLQSQIDMIPEKIELSVSELREEVDGELSKSESSIKLLKDEIELKVDVDGVTSAINLSEEGVRIDGSKVWITGDTKIDKASIKSAHIESLDADKIVAGSISTDKISIGGGSATQYTQITGDSLISRGSFTREWRGEVETHDVRVILQGGFLRARNDNHNRSLYYSDFGISTFRDGSGENWESSTSGTLEFFSYRYGNPRGLTVYSSGTFGVDTRNIMLETSHDITFKAGNMISFSSTNVRGTAIGVREPHTNFYIGVSGTRNGELRVTNKEFYNNGKPTYYDVKARDYRGRRLIDTGGSSYIYLGSNLGVRVTSKGTNRNSSVTYRPIQASAFQVRSSRDSKENIRKTVQKGLKAIKQLNVVDFNYKGINEQQTGFIAEDSSPISSDDSEFVDLNKAVALLTLAVQELDKKVDNNIITE